MKQLAVERIARGQDTTEARNEIMGMRVADAENRCRTLAQENQRIRCVCLDVRMCVCVSFECPCAHALSASLLRAALPFGCALCIAICAPLSFVTVYHFLKHAGNCCMKTRKPRGTLR